MSGIADLAVAMVALATFALPRMTQTQLAETPEWKSHRAGFVSDGTPSNLSVVRSMRGAIGRRLAVGALSRAELRELEEELGIDAKIGEEVSRIIHEFPGGGSVELRFFVVHEYRGEIENKIFRDVRWSPRSDLLSYDFLEADLTLVRGLAEGKII